jgi:hypothetical protein
MGTPMDEEGLNDEPPPIRWPRYRVEEEGDLLRLRRHWSRSSLIVAAFLLVWETFWTFGCVMLIRKVQNQPTLEHILFSIPFLTAWVFVAALLLYLIIGFESLELGPDGLEYRWGLLGLVLGRRRVPREEIKKASSVRSYVQHDEGSSIQYAVKVETLGRTLRFGQSIDEMESHWLVHLINKHLRMFGAVSKAPIEGFPSDSTYWRVDRWDTVEFRQRSRFDLATFFSLTFFCLFWNGIVGVFVLQLTRQFQWFLGLFLIPFVLIGFLVFLGWLGYFVVPLIVRRWVLGALEIEARNTFLGLGRTRRLDVSELGRVEFRKVAITGPGSNKSPAQSSTAEDDSPFAVALLDHEERERLVINRLTEGEARWIHRTFCDTYPNALARPLLEAAPSTEGLWDREFDG